jgi:hypothetical protein
MERNLPEIAVDHSRSSGGQGRGTAISSGHRTGAVAVKKYSRYFEYSSDPIKNLAVLD